MNAAQFKNCISNIAEGIHDGNLECIESVLDRIPVYHDLRKIGDAAESLIKRFHQLADKYNALKSSYRSKVREFEKDRIETDRSDERLNGLKERLANEAVYSESLLHKNDILLERINELRKENERLQSHSYEYNRIVEKEIEARKRRETHLLEQVASLEHRLQEIPTDLVSRRSRSSSSSTSSSSSASANSKESKESKGSKALKKDKDKIGRQDEKSDKREKQHANSTKDKLLESVRKVHKVYEGTDRDSDRASQIAAQRKSVSTQDKLEDSERNIDKTRQVTEVKEVTPRTPTITSETKFVDPEVVTSTNDITPRSKEGKPKSVDKIPKNGEEALSFAGETSLTNVVGKHEEDYVDPKVQELFKTERRDTVTPERQIQQLKQDNTALSKRLRQSKVEIINLNKKLTQLEQLKTDSNKRIERRPSEHADQLDITDGIRLQQSNRISTTEPGRSNDAFDNPDGNLRQQRAQNGEDFQLLTEKLKCIENENDDLRKRLTEIDPEYVQDKKALDHTGDSSRNTKERIQHNTEVVERHSERVQQLETENSQLKQRLVTIGDESKVIQDYDAKVYRLEEEKKALEGRLTEAENQMRNLDQSGTVSQTFERENRSIFDRFRSNRQDNYDRGSWWTDRKIDRLERSQRNVEKKLRDSRDNLKDRDRTISKLENEIKSLRANDGELRKRMQQERQQLQKVKVELQQTESQSKALRRSLSTTDKPLTADVTGSKIVMKAEEINRSKAVPLQSSDNEDSSRGSKELEAENRQLKERILELQKQLERQPMDQQIVKRGKQDISTDRNIRRGSIDEEEDVKKDIIVRKHYSNTSAENRLEHDTDLDQASSTDVQRLNKDNKELRDRLNKALQESKDLEESKIRLEREKREAEDRIRKFEENQIQMRRDGTVTSFFESHNRESNSGDSHLQRQLEEEIQRLREELRQIQDEKEEMRNSYEKQLHEGHHDRNVESDLKQAEDQIRELQNRNTELQNELEQQRNELHRVHTEAQDSNRVERSVIGEKTEALEAETPVVHQQADVTGMPESASTDSQASIMRELESKVQSLEKENKDLNERLNASQGEHTNQITDVKQDVESSTGLLNLGRVETADGNQNEEVQKLQSELNQLKQENEDLQNRITQLQRNLRDAEQDLRRARSDLKNVEDRNSELQTSHNDLQRQLHQQQGETERLETELSQTHISALEEQGMEEAEEFMMNEKHEKTGGVKKKKKSKKTKGKELDSEKIEDKDTLAEIENSPKAEISADKEDILGALQKATSHIDEEDIREDWPMETVEAKVIRLVKEIKNLQNSVIDLKRQLETHQLTLRKNEKTDALDKYHQANMTDEKGKQDTPNLTSTKGTESVMTQTDEVVKDQQNGLSPTEFGDQSGEPFPVIINRLETENRALQERSSDNSKAHQAEVSQLKLDLQNLQNKAEDSQDRCNRLEERIRDEKQKVNEIQSELDKERERNRDLQARNTDLQRQLEQCRTDLERVETEQRQTRESNQIVAERGEKLEEITEEKIAPDEAHHLESGYHALDDTDGKETSTDDHTNIQNENHQLMEENRDLKERLKEFTEDSKGTEDLKVQIIYLQNEKSEAEERLRRLQRIHQAQNDPKYYEKNGENVFTSSKREQSEVEKLNRDLQKVQDENDELQQSYVRLQSDLQTDRYELQRLRVDFQKIQKEKMELETRHNSTMDDDSLEEHIDTTTDLNTGLNTGNTESEEINELRIQNIYLLNEKKELEDRLKRLQAEKKKMQLRDSRMDYNVLELKELKKSNIQLKRLTEQQQREIQKLKMGLL